MEDPLACHTVALKHPVLNNHELEQIRSIDTGISRQKPYKRIFGADGNTVH
jgi:glutamate synthase (NADPH/NADH) large chain